MSILELQNWWIHQRVFLLRLAIALMSAAALPRLACEFTRLLWLSGPLAAIDLRQRYQEVQLWFAGQPVYDLLTSAVYPPASYSMLWPLLGYPSFTLTRWIWAVTTIAALSWLIYLLIQVSRASGALERAFIALMTLSMYATGITIGNGQLTIHVLAALVTAVLISSSQERPSWSKDGVAGGLVAVALVKPTLAAPFFWIFLFAPGRLRSALIAVLGYAALAFLAAAFQPGDILSLHQQWLSQGIGASAWGSAGGGADPGAVGTEVGSMFTDIGYSDLHSLLGTLGLSEWNSPSAILLLLVLGGWVYLHREVDLWLLLGVAAIVSRLWTYHRVYDDLLILLPMISLFRLTKGHITKDHTATKSAAVSGLLLAIAVLAALVPASLRLLQPPFDLLFKGGELTVWMAILTFLLQQAWCKRQAESKQSLA